MYQQYPYANYIGMASGENKTDFTNSNGNRHINTSSNYDFNFNNKFNYNNLISPLPSTTVGCYDFSNSNAKQQNMFYQLDSAQVF